MITRPVAARLRASMSDLDQASESDKQKARFPVHSVSRIERAEKRYSYWESSNIRRMYVTHPGDGREVVRWARGVAYQFVK
jgi:hypothetical protein